MTLDIRQQITDKIIQSLEQGVLPWKCPFERTVYPINYKTKHKYQGINTLVLWLNSYLDGYTSNYWIGYSQAKSLGGYVRKKERGTPIVIYNKSIKLVNDVENKDNKEVIRHFYKVHRVFNLDQIDGLEILIEKPSFEPVENIEKKLLELNVSIRNQGEKAFFDSRNDYINMPYKSKFNDQNSYYATLFHELIHWTGHSERINRLDNSSNSSRALEELVAEIGASFLSAEFNLNHNLNNSVSYIDSWLESLKNDKSFIFKASARASEAIKFLNLNQKEQSISQVA